MKTSRRIFITLLLVTLTALVGAVIAVLNSTNTVRVIFAVLTLILVSAGATLNCWSKAVGVKRVIDMFTPLVAGGTVGSLEIFSLLQLLIVAGVAILVMVVFFFGFYGHIEEEEKAMFSPFEDEE